MRRLILVASLVATVALAACTGTTAAPTPSPSPAPSDPSPTPASPSSPPPAPVSPSVQPRPAPSVTPSPATPRPSADVTAAERYLLEGVRRGAIDCAPAAGSDDLPAKAIAGIECVSDDPAVTRVGFYLFEDDTQMLAAYVRRMTEEGVALDSGPCQDGEGESAYTPGEGMIPFRNGCFINDEGMANYRATMPGSHVYIGILGRAGDVRALEDFAWVGNKDTPGTPTLWAPPS